MAIAVKPVFVMPKIRIGGGGCNIAAIQPALISADLFARDCAVRDTAGELHTTSAL